MPFTTEERLAWHAEKSREERPPSLFKPEPIGVCVHCHQPFGSNEGIVTDDFALCDICFGD